MFKIAIASGKGGTGKTFVATNIFYSLFKNNLRIQLIDCDAEAPNALIFFKTCLSHCHEVYQQVPVINLSKCTYCGKCVDWCNYHAFFFLAHMKMIRVLEDMCHGCGACFAACEQEAIESKDISQGKVSLCTINPQTSIIEARMNTGIMSPVSVIKDAIKNSDTLADYIILDAPPGTSCPFIQTIADCDYIVLVTEPTPFGLSDLRQSIETLKTLNKKFGVIINRSDIGNNAVKQYLEREEISLLLEIPYNKEIATIYSRGELAGKYQPELDLQLSDLVQGIEKQYGNSSHQR